MGSKLNIVREPLKFFKNYTYCFVSPSPRGFLSSSFFLIRLASSKPDVMPVVSPGSKKSNEYYSISTGASGCTDRCCSCT